MTRALAGDFTEIRVVDIAALAPGASAAARAQAVAALGAALEASGFAYLSGHGVPQPLIDRLFDLSRRFHALPLDTKAKIAINADNRGYLKMASSTIVTSTVAKNTRPNQSESLIFMHEHIPARLKGTPLQGENQWPDDDVPEFRAVVPDYMARMTALGRSVAGAVAEYLGEARDFFAPHLVEPTEGLRLLHYPPQPDEPDLHGAAPHTDYGFITMLAQDGVGGLEVRNGQGAWVAAPPIPGTFVMNVGDVLTRWSNGRLPSVPHRARNIGTRDRYSAPFFFDAAMDTIISCPPAIPARGEKAAYPPFCYGDYLLERLNKNYAYRQKAS
ncbi:MAG TPA: 2OG-Fe(II) oxygenase family protein [Magnetospirillaceae bacterium]|jgi:isopenicillin N synthase-like dioxygenase